MSKATLLKQLFIIPSLLLLGLAGKSQILSEGFESPTFPPAGWINTHTVGGDPTAVWERASTRSFAGQDFFGDSLFADPNTGTGTAKFSSWDYDAGNGAVLGSSNFDLSSVSAPQVVSFWIFRDNGLMEADSISVYINTTQSLTGASFLGKVTRFIEGEPSTPGEDGWYKFSFVIPASFNSPTNYLLFSAVSDFGNNMFIDDVVVEDLPVAPTCTTNITPADGASGLYSPVNLSWNAAPNAANYTLYLSTTNPPAVPADSILDVTTTSVSLSGFDPSTTYYWYVIPKNVSGAAVGCASNLTSFTTASTPANDLCADAVNLTVGTGFCDRTVLGNLSFADSTTGLGGASCQTTALQYDVWYKLTVPATGNVIVQTSAVNLTVNDLVVEAYSGTCGSLTSIGCADDGSADPDPSPTVTNYHSRLELTGRTPGEIVYIRVMPYSTRNIGAFAICAFDASPSVMPPVAAGSPNACTPATAINIDSAFKYTWVTFKDAGGNVVAQIYPNGNILGNTNASFYVNSGAIRTDGGGIFYLDRNLTVEPSAQPTTDIITSVYFKDAELSALVAASPGLIIDSLNCTKTPQTCATSATAGPGGTLITQGGSGDYMGDHFVDLLHNSYSTFYLHAGNTVLPVSLISFNAQRTGRVNRITWTTGQEINTSLFIVERSTDGRNYSPIGQLPAAGNSSNSLNYTFIDFTPFRGTNFYRLKIVDNSGHEKFSAVKNVRNEGTADVAVYPNPVKDVMLVNITSDNLDKALINITDMNGKTVYVKTMSITEGMNYINVNTANISSGTYVIKIQLNEDLVVRKFNKL